MYWFIKLGIDPKLSKRFPLQQKWAKVKPHLDRAADEPEAVRFGREALALLVRQDLGDLGE